jgi:hypothetical protein
MEKSVLHIHLMYRSVVGKCNRENCSDSGRFDDRAESLTIINPMLLSKTAKDPTSLVAIKSTIRKKLVPKYPFSSDHISTCRPGNKRPRVIGLQSYEFFTHSITSIRISKSATICLRQRRQGGRMKIETLHGLAKPVFAPRNHAMIILHGSDGHHTGNRRRRVRPGRSCRRG